MQNCGRCGHVNPETQKFCGECGAPLSAAEPSREVRKTVSILFVDVVGSTSLGEDLDPERLRKIMTQYFEQVRSVLEHHGASVEKFIGDAVMAVFGIPVLREDDALRAVRAAIDVQPVIEELNEQTGQALQVRIGVNTGEVVAGEISTRQNLVTGDAVNVAARLQQMAPPGTILLGEATQTLLEHAVETTPVELALKGKSEAVTAYRLEGLSDMAVSHPRRARSTLVGRKRQRRQLMQAFEAAVEDSDCHLFTILGAPGVGKSRLVDEFIAEIDSSARVAVGRCLSYGEAITYWPLVEAIRSLVDVSEMETSQEAASRLAPLLEPLEERGRFVLGSLLGATDEIAAGEDIAISAQQLFDSVARSHPLVLIFDDIHWAEHTFLNLIEHLADGSRGVPLLILCMARPEFLEARPGWGGGRTNATTILLEPLDRAAAADLISNVLGGTIDEQVKEKVMDAAEGNPLFVEEMVSMLVEEGTLVSDGGRWRLSSASDLRIPTSLQLLLAARVDGLGHDERRVISHAAVVGKVFERAALVALDPQEANEQVDKRLTTLARRELIRRDPASIDVYQFRHILIRDAAYESLPKEERARLHEHFCIWLSERSRGQEADLEEILGYHFEQAARYYFELGTPRSDLSEAAATHLLSSGRRAFGRSDMTAAVNLLDRVASLATGPTRTEALLWKAEANAYLGRFADAEAALGEVRAMPDAGRAALALAEVIDTSMVHEGKQIGITAALRRLHEAARVLEEERDDSGAARAWRQIADHEAYLGRSSLADEAHRVALRFAEASGQRGLYLHSIAARVMDLFWGPVHAEEGLKEIEQFRPLASESIRIDRVINRVTAGFLGLQGRLEEALGIMKRARELDALSSSELWISLAAQVDGIIMRRVDPEGAISMMETSYASLRRLGELGGASTVAGDLANMHLDGGGGDEVAWDLAEEALAITDPDDFDALATAKIAMARILLRRGDDRALGLVTEALGVVAPTDYLQRRAFVSLHAAEINQGFGRLSEAVTLFKDALDQYELKGDLWSIDQARKRHPELSE